MSDTRTTKQMIANAFREILENNTISSVTVGAVCDKCNINRKSFYYHFQDKFDLVKWIFKAEFDEFTDGKKYENAFDFLYAVCSYLEANKSFYGKVFSAGADNVFFGYFYKMFFDISRSFLQKIYDTPKEREFYEVFFADSVTSCIRKWILNKSPYTAYDIAKLINKCVCDIAGRKERENEK